MTSQETQDKIIHYVPGNWGGRAFLTAVCGARVVYTHASSLTTNCLECEKCRQEEIAFHCEDIDYQDPKNHPNWG